MTSKNHAPILCLHCSNQNKKAPYQVLIDQLKAIRIDVLLEDSAKKSDAVLFIPDLDAPEEKFEEHIRTLISQNKRIIVGYFKAKPMPFFQLWKLLGMGVEDVVRLNDRTDISVEIQAKLNRWSIIDRLLKSARVKNLLIGSSPAWIKTLRQVIEIACFTTAPVLVLGESGTGKELISRLIHDLDRRPDKSELVLLDCTSVVPELSGSEFFGHEKGAYTNAVSAREGAFALADRGTLFLDEVGELPLPLQAELLRVSQDGLYKRVGSNTWKKTKFRLLCATNRNLREEVKKGNFREDLYYRLSSCIVHLPPLRKRRPDIPELAAYFLREALSSDPSPSFDPLVIKFLMTRDYPGNVRQLKQLITRMAYRHAGKGPITIGDIPGPDRDNYTITEHDWHADGFKRAIRRAIANGIGLKDIKRIAGDIAIEIAVEDADGNLQEAARKLEVSDRLVQGYWARRPG